MAVVTTAVHDTTVASDIVINSGEECEASPVIPPNEASQNAATNRDDELLVAAMLQSESDQKKSVNRIMYTTHPHNLL